MKGISFDFNNMMSASIGDGHGATDKDVSAMSGPAREAFRNMESMVSDQKTRIEAGLEWMMLPYQDAKSLRHIQSLGSEIRASCENVISLGIGGSYLGLKAAQDALAPAYYNDFDKVRGNGPRVFFEGNNLDPDTLSVLLANLDPRKTSVVVISKSGETTETKAAFCVIQRWLRHGVGPRYGRRVFAITDPVSGALRSEVKANQKLDGKSFRSLPVLKGVGGRYSEFNVGLLLMAITGIDIHEVLKGASAMQRTCMAGHDVFKNPAMSYAVLHIILYRKKNKDISIMMPFSEKLRSTADWYVQLLAESLGKKYDRRGRVVNVGRTPVAARGTNDLHSIQQNNIEGENNKTVTFVKVAKFDHDIKIPGRGDFMSGRPYSELMSSALEATEWALARQSRPSCTITLPRLDPYNWGGLLFFFEMATAFEGELLGVNAFDQPGVEGYKNYMYHKLGKPGLSKEIERDILSNPLKKKNKYIVKT